MPVSRSTTVNTLPSNSTAQSPTDGNLRFQSLGGTKRPARATATLPQEVKLRQDSCHRPLVALSDLVLDGGDNTLLAPVQRSREVGDVLHSLLTTAV